jgi:hypothetical protein
MYPWRRKLLYLTGGWMRARALINVEAKKKKVLVTARN